MYQIYPLGTPASKEGQLPGGGFFGEVPSENDLKSKPQSRLLELRKWYDHIQELGVTAIYFSPLFESETHGYDTVDYYKIDRRLGDIEEFKTMLKELQARGIKVILDGVFNHTGRKFFAFQDILKHGKDWSKSVYKNWYFIKDGNSTYGDPFAYRSWEGHEELPELDVENSDVREYLFGVAKFWLGEVGVDGWRLDVAHELPPSFWRDFRSACTEVKGDHVLLGEVIHGDYNTWVGPTKGLLHSGTNYQLSKALWSSIRDNNFWELKHNFERDQQLYRDMSLVTFLSNHDVSRVSTLLQSPQHVYLAHFLLFTARGIPCIYYGDEIRVRGAKEDGDCALRCKMPEPDPAEWPEGGKALYESVKHLTKLRLDPACAALRVGNQVLLYNTNHELVFARTAGHVSPVIVAVNSSPEHVHIEVSLAPAGVHAGLRLRGVWGDGADAGHVPDNLNVRIHVPPHTGRVFVCENPAAAEAPAAADPAESESRPGRRALSGSVVK